MKRRIPNSRLTTGIGYIIIPKGVDRDSFVINCLRKETVSLITQDGSYINNVNIDVDCLQRIEFPENSDSNGSCVVFVNEFNRNIPIVVAVLSKGNENQLLKEGEFKLFKKTKAGVVVISGDSNKGNLFIQLMSDENSGGEFHIDLLNNNKSSKLNINVKGTINIHATDTIRLNSDVGIKFSNTNNDSGLEAAVLGDTLKQIFDDFIDEVSNITVTTAIGTQPILNKVQILDFKNRTEDFLSTFNTIQ